MKIHLVFVYVITFCLFACGDQDTLEYKVADYQQRLANVLESAAPVLPKVHLPSYPTLSELTLDLTETNIQLFEYYQLKHCTVHSLIAERNTTLGRLQLPSTRYLYERKLLDGLALCIDSTTDKTLKLKLQQWLQSKQNNLPLVWANLMQTSNELKSALSSNGIYIQGSKDDGLSNSKNALSFLLGLNENSKAKDSKLETHLAHLNQYRLPAKLWLSQLLLSKQLNQSTLWLKQQRTYLKCRDGKAETKVTYLANVFQRYFIERIQPIAGKINHYQYQLSPLFDELVQNQHVSAAFTTYIQQQQQSFDLYQHAMTEHIQFWQTLFKRCNIQSGRKAA